MEDIFFSFQKKVSMFGVGEWFVVMVSILLVLVWPVMAILALGGLRKRKLPETAKVLWTILVLTVPVLGPLGFWMMDPGRDHSIEE
jgi:hypothetical protein